MNSGRSLQHLIRDVLDVGRSGSDRLAADLQPIDVAACIDAAANAVASLATQTGVELSREASGSPLHAMAGAAAPLSSQPDGPR